jgi:hypothetical protein
MKNKVLLPIVFFATIVVAIGYIAVSGKNHVDAVQESAVLLEQRAQLKDSVVSLECVKKESIKKLKEADSVLTSQNELITSQQKKIVSLDKEAKAAKAQPKSVMAIEPKIIYVHDTVFVTEKKNFWGRTKKTVVSVQAIDSVFSEEQVDSLETK